MRRLTAPHQWLTLNVIGALTVAVTIIASTIAITPETAAAQSEQITVNCPGHGEVLTTQATIEFWGSLERLCEVSFEGLDPAPETNPAPARPATCGGEPVTIYGTTGNDRIFGTDGVDVIHAMQGNDYVNGLEGDDIICGGTGNDELLGHLGFDVLYGAQGNDYLQANGARSGDRRIEDIRGSRMFGGAGHDYIQGSNRWDRMQGGPGHDVLLDGSESLNAGGRDWMRGGTGHDLLISSGLDDLSGGPGNDQHVFNEATVNRNWGTDTCVVTYIQGNPNKGRPTSPSVTHCEGVAIGSDVAWPVGSTKWTASDTVAHRSPRTGEHTAITVNRR